VKGEEPTEEALPAPAGSQLLLERIGSAILLALPGGLVVWFGFASGGFFPGGPALVALVLAQVLAVRTTLAPAPFAGMGRLATAVTLLIAAFAGWALASGGWSHSPSRALIEFDRVLCYLLLFVLMASAARTASRLRWVLRGVATGFFIVCAAGFFTRTLPDVFPVSPNIANDRLSFPVSYSNALGLAAALGLILCFGLAASVRERRPARVLGAAAVPLLGATILFTFSRGAILSGAIGLVVFAVVGRPRGLLSGLIATAVPTVVAVVAAYRAGLLATADPTTPAATAQGHHVAFVVVLCCLVAAALRLAAARWLDRGLSEARLPARWQRREVRLGAGALGGVVLLAALLLLHVPATVKRQYDNFVNNNTTPTSTDLRGRLNVLDNGYRIAFWSTGMRSFRSHPFNGAGGGTYTNEWARARPAPFTATNAHSLYVETLSDYGLVGGVLLFAALLTILVTLLLRARGSRRTLYATLFAATLTWLIHAAVDWDWQMPVVTAWLFGVGGVVVAASVRRRDGEAVPVAPRAPRQGTRVVIGLCCLVSAITPAVIYISHGALGRAETALRRNDCNEGIKAARSAISALAARWEPYELLGYCDIFRGEARAGIAAMKMAQKKDPGNWEPHFGLAVARANEGEDPMPALRSALQLNPREPSSLELLDALKGGDPHSWGSRARQVAEKALADGKLAITGS
jgi:O-antigen ligase